MNDQMPFIIEDSKFDPRHIGLPEKRFYYLVLKGSPQREWYFVHTKDELYKEIKELDNNPYHARFQIFKIQKDKRSSSFYVFFKVFDNLHDFMDDDLLKDYQNYLNNLDPQANLIHELLK